jgi:hypothetical protein
MIRLLPIVFVSLLLGCSGGRLTLRSAERPRQAMRGSFNRGVYGFDNKNSLDVLLIEEKAGEPAQAVHLQMHWSPRAGRTPIDENATNAVVHYIVFAGDSAGVYSGAGFLFPQTEPGTKSLAGEVRNASLRLQDSGESFEDPLGLAIASGSFRATRNDLETQRLLREIRLRLRDKLGYPRLVDAAP